ncbi:MAG: Na(+)-translocating NADH-quinone reductase subunit A [Gammaproteobacteria bacterium]|nr:Na(+)-translocating NADH-quinone reductase subunit A [Gammaproteobacteria bacterium]
MIKLKRGMDIPISGLPEQVIHEASPARSVALIGYDYVGMRPTMAVQVGDRVKQGQLLFSDKKNPGVQFTAPSSGTVAAINRGARRVLQSVVIDIEGSEAQNFGSHSADQARALSSAAVRQQLLDSGMWSALRTRPFSKVPQVDASPAAVFVTAMDTHPLAADPAVVIAEQSEAYGLGQDLLATLTDGPVYVCTAAGSDLPAGSASTVQQEQFAGPHPAGLAGTHIHHLAPVSADKTVWTIGYQDVIAVGRLFLDGCLYNQRVVALCGPQVSQPRLLRTQLGVDLQELCAGELLEGENRIISGSVLGGRRVQAGTAYLGRYHHQVSVLREGRYREFLGWFSPGVNKHSSLGIYLSGLLPRKLFPMSTNTNGSERAMVPMGTYENVVPMDILPTQLLRALIVGDTEVAQQLGCLELEEEDLALCSYVCPGKYEYGPILRDNLTLIEKEG